jgi:ferredoxin-type protein NapH
MRRLSRRRWFQVGAMLLFNPWLPNFFKGTISQAWTKGLCVPVLNCYSCPSAVVACPIGSLQHTLGALRFRLSIGEPQFSLYALGFLGIAGGLAGRFPCGWLCPFGLLQELLHKIPSLKLSIPRPLGYLRYAVLGLLVVALPLLVLDATGFGIPWFCKWLCPAGTLEAGLPLVAANAGIRAQVGLMFAWKVGILVLFLVLMVFTMRPFCRTACPLGALLGLFNRVSLFRLRANTTDCTDCGRCEQVCPVEVKVRKAPNSPDCIRCLRCVRACDHSCISAVYVPHERSGGAAACLGGADRPSE